MNKLFKFLDRFHGKTTVRPAREEDIPVCVEMGYTHCLEVGFEVTSDAREGLVEHFETVLGSSQAVVLLAERRGEVQGMVCCGVSPGNPWNSEKTMSVWFLYVRPMFRRTPGVMMQLMRACLACGYHWGVRTVQITVDTDNGHLVDVYERRFGFRREFVNATYSLKLED